MTSKVVVHSNAKRLAQVVGVALLIAVALVGLKKFSVWWKAPHDAITQSQATGSTTQPPSNLGMIVGSSRVIDGDTIVIQGQHIRLEGIDAPEAAQRCGTAGEEWACGQDASVALSNWLSGKTISCQPKGKDHHGRTLARCFVSADDVQSWMVANGWALAYRKYSSDYVDAENLAKSKKAGLWKGAFQAPWDWRSAHQHGLE